MNKKLLQLIGRSVAYTYPIISMIGFIFNVLAFIVFSGKKFEKTSFSIYFRFLIISDILSLLLPINRILELNFNIKLQDVSDVFCVIRVFYSYITIALSAWSTVIISIDRACSIIYPNRFLFRKNTKFRIIVCLLNLIFNIIIYGSLFDLRLGPTIINDNGTNQTFITMTCKSDQIYMFWLDLFNSDIVPFALMITFTLYTLRFIFKARGTAGSSVNKKDLKFAATSITLNVIFLIFNTPYCIYNIYSFYISVDPYLDNLLFIIFLALLYCNSCSVFFINYMVNSLFKQELGNIFHKNSKNNLIESSRSIQKGITRSNA